MDWRARPASGAEPEATGGSEIRPLVDLDLPPATCGDRPFVAARAAVYARAFGPPAEVIAAPPGRAPAIDVHVHPPGFGDRTFYTLVTSGMSDLAMRVPADVGGAGRRAELILYVDVPSRGTVELLQTLAVMPHRAGAWLGHGHTLPNGNPPQPLFPGSRLDTILVLDTIVAPERDVHRHVMLDGDPLNVLWIVPLTAAECRLKLQAGTPALLDRFNEARLSFVFDAGRASVV